MKALVTGRNGFSGRHLCRYLQDIGMSVHSIGNRPVPGIPDHHLLNITDIGQIKEALERVRPDLVFHLAGVTASDDPLLYYTVNTQYAVALLTALEKAGMSDRPVLLVGSAAEYGMVPPERLPILEDLPPHPYGHYGISKLSQTLAGLSAARSGRPVVMVRPFNIIGRGMPATLVLQSFVSQICRILDGLSPPVIDVGNLDSSRDFIDVHDVVRIYTKLIQTPSAYGHIFNVCTGKAVAISSLLSKLLAITGISIQTRIDHSRYKPIDVKVHYGSFHKLQQFIGEFKFTDLESTLHFVLENTV
ncbi:MAG: NAD-dependent epimerase/dehydratase family protein [Spirochaetaceae bacterium]|nr:NAD-dependent epimerase/dehydratase family protein [Spirochaetaceae bacterium]